MKKLFLLGLLFFLSIISAEDFEKPLDIVHFEISPHAGFMGGGGALGLSASMNYSSIALEMTAEELIGHMATCYPLTANFIVNLASTAKIVPYGIVGGGVLFTVPENAVGSNTVNTIGLNFGGGLRYYLSPKIGVRFESKQLFSRLDNKEGQNKLVIFQGLSLGVIFVFG